MLQVLVQYGASWCQQCKALLPTFLDLSQKVCTPCRHYASRKVRSLSVRHHIITAVCTAPEATAQACHPTISRRACGSLQHVRMTCKCHVHDQLDSRVTCNPPGTSASTGISMVKHARVQFDRVDYVVASVEHMHEAIAVRTWHHTAEVPAAHPLLRCRHGTVLHGGRYMAQRAAMQHKQLQRHCMRDP